MKGSALFFTAGYHRFGGRGHKSTIKAINTYSYVFSGTTTYSFERHVTVIWFATSAGYEVCTKYLWQSLLLSIKEGSNFKVSLVSVGCCFDPIDVYKLGNFKDFDSEGTISITKETDFPHRALKSRNFTTKGDMVLRESPRIDDTYDEGYSPTIKLAVFGNVLSKYILGAEGSLSVIRQTRRTGPLSFWTRDVNRYEHMPHST